MHINLFNYFNYMVGTVISILQKRKLRHIEKLSDLSKFIKLLRERRFKAEPILHYTSLMKKEVISYLRGLTLSFDHQGCS